MTQRRTIYDAKGGRVARKGPNLSLAGATAIACAVPILAFAQPNLANAPTATRPITAPSFAPAPTVAPQRPILPSGQYILTLHFPLPPNASTGAHTEIDKVKLTHTGASLTLTPVLPLPYPQSFTGSIDPAGMFQVSQSRPTGAIDLEATAVGASAQGTFHRAGQVNPSQARGGFDLALDPNP